MITFTRFGGKSHVIHVIPSISEPKVEYDMYCGDHFIGHTYGQHNGILTVNLFGQGIHSFKVSEIERFLKEDISVKELFHIGSIIS